MKCPRTGTDLTLVKVGGIAVDISEACGGVFFDNHELEDFDEKSEKRGEVLVEHIKKFTPPMLDLTKRIKCPKCTDVVMARHFYSSKKKVEIDECPRCGGIWFDFGELEKLRELFPAKKDREKAGREFEHEMVNSSVYKGYIKGLEEREATAKRTLERRTRVNQIGAFFDMW